MKGDKSKATTSQFSIVKRTYWGPEIEVRRQEPNGEPGRLEAVFLGSDAEAAARVWLEEPRSSDRKGVTQGFGDQLDLGRAIKRLKR